MVIFDKYRLNLYLNKNNFIYYHKNISNSISKKVNYVFTHKNKFMRSFIYFYSFFLIFDNFSSFSYKNNPEFIIKINTTSLLFMAENFNNFF